MNGAGEGERLPHSIGGLIDLGFAAWAQRAPFYLASSVAVFALCGAIEALWPAHTAADRAIKLFALVYAEVFGLAFTVAAVALGVATRVAGEHVSARTLLTSALERWPAVIGAMVVVQLVVELTVDYSALGPLPDPPALALLTAPLIWLLWAVINLAGPVAALSGERPLIAMLTSFPRAVALSLRRGNGARVAVLGFVTIVPTLIAAILNDVLFKHGVAHGVFWANVPIDALTVGPLAAIQTAFTLDFVRRASADQPPPR